MIKRMLGFDSFMCIVFGIIIETGAISFIMGFPGLIRTISFFVSGFALSGMITGAWYLADKVEVKKVN